MTGYQYASFIRHTCIELEREIKVTPIIGLVYRENSIPNPSWDHILCHPEDKNETDEKLFKHPYRDI